MRSVPIVAMEPSRQVFGSVIGVGVCGGVGPLAQRGLDEALGFSVGLGRIGFGPDVLQAEAFAGAGEGEGFVAGAVVGHDAHDLDAEACVIGEGGLEEGRGALLPLIGHHFGNGDAGRVVDADVDELPAEPFAAPAPIALASAIAGDAVSEAIDPAELLDVDVDELARVLPLVATHRLGRLPRPPPVEAPAPPAARGARPGDAPPPAA